jgi:hypothetical protein
VGVAVLIAAALMLAAAATARASSEQDPCTAGHQCSTNCVINGVDGGLCVVRECATATECAELVTAVPGADPTPPEPCPPDTGAFPPCTVAPGAAGACAVAADGFGAVCSRGHYQWRWDCIAGPDCPLFPPPVISPPFVVGGRHYVPPAPPQPAPAPATPTMPASPTGPTPAPPDPGPAAPAPPPTAPGEPPPPTPVAEPPAPAPLAPAPQTTPKTRTRRAGGRLVVPFSSGFRLPPGFDRAQGCRGRVRLVLKAKGRVLARRTVALNRNCRYSATFRIAPARLRGARTVTVVARFLGNRVLGSTAARPYRLPVQPQPA